MELVRTSKFNISFSNLVLAMGLLVSTAARADLYGFQNISGNSAVDAAIGEDQLSVNVTRPDGGQVLFTFRNAGSDPSSITLIHFDDGVLDSLASVGDSDLGVSFSPGARQPVLPAGNDASPPFVVTPGLSASSDSRGGVQPNGVNPGETVGLLYDLQGSSSFANVIADLSSGALRIGIHVQGFDGGGSESFINDPQPVPVPGALALGMFGMSVLGVKLRRLA